MLAVGIDVGGTKVAAGLVDEQGRVLAEHRVPSPTTSPADIVSAIATAVEQLGGNERVGAVGVGAAGFLDSDRERVLFAPNLAWRDEPLRASVSDRLGLPVIIENDADAMAWGEYRFGAGRGVEVLVALTVGTGIGGGLVVAGRLFRGGYGIGAEVGHVALVPDGRPCGCGQRGCWEQYASGRALEALAEQRLGRHLDGPEVTAAAAGGDPAALGCFTEIGRWLGRGIAGLAAVLDPQAFVVGGGVADAGELLLAPAREALRELLTGTGHRPLATVRAAELGAQAGLIGAADLARAAADAHR